MLTRSFAFSFSLSASQAEGTRKRIERERDGNKPSKRVGNEGEVGKGRRDGREEGGEAGEEKRGWRVNDGKEGLSRGGGGGGRGGKEVGACWFFF